MCAMLYYLCESLYAMLCGITLCDAMLCYVIRCDAMRCDAMRSCVMQGGQDIPVVGFRHHCFWFCARLLLASSCFGFVRSSSSHPSFLIEQFPQEGRRGRKGNEQGEDKEEI